MLTKLLRRSVEAMLEAIIRLENSNNEDDPKKCCCCDRAAKFTVTPTLPPKGRYCDECFHKHCTP